MDEKQLAFRSIDNALEILSKKEVFERYVEVKKELQEYKLENESKIEFYDTVANSKDMFEMSAVAKLVGVQGMGRNKIFRLLRNIGVLRQSNEPYQEFVDRGYFKLIEQKVTLPFGEIKINKKTIVSQKGIDYISKILKEHERGLNE